jgi:TPR repeat protein
MKLRVCTGTALRLKMGLIPYEDGRLLPQNLEEAVKWFKLAADQGSVEAQVSYARLLYSGNGMIRDLQLAADYFEKAALQGNAAAQYIIAAMYEDGDHTEVDRVRAYAWLRLAAEQKYEGAESGLEELCSLMSASELASGKVLMEEIATAITKKRR